MDRFKSNQYFFLGIIFIVTILFWFIVFFNVVNSRPSGVAIDSLSGEVVNYEGLKSAQTPNPNLPYFAGFNLITDAGVQSDDMRYIQDVLINFSLYNKHVKSAKISYVKDSFMRHPTNVFEDTYSFKFGINGDDIHTMNVVSESIEKEEIKINITDSSNKKVFERTFHLFTL